MVGEIVLALIIFFVGIPLALIVVALILGGTGLAIIWLNGFVLRIKNKFIDLVLLLIFIYFGIYVLYELISGQELIGRVFGYFLIPIIAVACYIYYKYVIKAQRANKVKRKIIGKICSKCGAVNPMLNSWCIKCKSPLENVYSDQQNEMQTPKITQITSTENNVKENNFFGNGI
jgi:ribosomal protein L40E